jgi:hypothetical protein
MEKLDGKVVRWPCNGVRCGAVDELSLGFKSALYMMVIIGLALHSWASYLLGLSSFSSSVNRAQESN